MSRFVGDQLPVDLLARLSVDRALDSADRALILCTVDELGWPHPAMLSSLEFVARDARNLRLAPHANSRTARNLRANGRLTVVLAEALGVYYIKGDVLLLDDAAGPDRSLSLFNMRVDSVLQDDPAAYEGARLTSGIQVARTGIDDNRAHALLAALIADDEPPTGAER